ncbi:S41 family peptidase [Pseudoduganella namucuonensis]|uniref:C-terminal processing protease CtpA/Prc, contains a PDZ domain n=1 Tax=Pseudoduganella namucuonensis TaxID=1035707 RepID=A0A1I7LKI6_9BURK|nr:S41 family peptidase [Pseudoduganella namucuonensis]SFV10113.1 C-terminal processing protease CtpA/Prc, contains a PDZ domain [Pseudoduganella namucuonensis]
MKSIPIRARLVALATLAILAGCGGSGNSDTGTTNTTAATRQGAAAASPSAAPAADAALAEVPALPAYSAFQNLCAAPRAPGPGKYYADRPGTLDDEKSFLRLWSEDTYLWYSELPAADPAAYATAPAYFNALKTPLLTASGKPKDRYHFTYDSDEYEELSRGVELGYGLTFVRNAAPNIPRTWRIASIAPGSPAEKAGLKRGDRLEQVDYEDFVWKGDAATVAKLNAGLFPVKAGETHEMVFSRGFQMLMVFMQAQKVDVAPVQNTRVLETPTGKVGYLTFNSHNAVSELQLIESFTALQNAKVNDLVLDLRYNGGGLLVIASELAYMIAGPGPTSGKTFEHTLNNGKGRQETPLIFLPLSLGLHTAKPAPYLKPLPTLNLKRVTILAGPGTCSASESVINGLRGVDVEVTLIGGQTCGKPYAFVPTPNCGTTYFTIQYQGVNAKGFGDYSDGFAPTCAVADDFTRHQGDPAEALLAEALHYRANGKCSAPAASARARAGGASPGMLMVPVRPPVSEISIRTP